MVYFGKKIWKERERERQSELLAWFYSNTVKQARKKVH